MKLYDCICGAQTTKHNWCYTGKHQRQSTKPKHTNCLKCPNKHHANGLCQKHYMRWYRSTHKITNKASLNVNKIIRNNMEDFWTFVQQELGKK